MPSKPRIPVAVLGNVAGRIARSAHRTSHMVVDSVVSPGTVEPELPAAENEHPADHQRQA
jgi:hypothetical protein